MATPIALPSGSYRTLPSEVRLEVLPSLVALQADGTFSDFVKAIQHDGQLLNEALEVMDQVNVNLTSIAEETAFKTLRHWEVLDFKHIRIQQPAINRPQLKTIRGHYTVVLTNNFETITLDLGRTHYPARDPTKGELYEDVRSFLKLGCASTCLRKVEIRTWSSLVKNKVMMDGGLGVEGVMRLQTFRGSLVEVWTWESVGGARLSWNGTTLQ